MVGVMLILLIGTFHGLWAYRLTIGSIESRLAERLAAQSTQETLRQLLHLAEHDPVTASNPNELQRLLQMALDGINIYQARLTGTVTQKHDRDHGREEIPLSNQMRQQLETLIQGLNRAPPSTIKLTAGGVPPFDPALREEVKNIELAAVTLVETIDTDLNRRIARGKKVYFNTLVAVVAICLVGAVCMVGLGKMAYRWLVDPIRDLHEKVQRVAQGNFDTRVEVHSGDEMQDLAEAFNHMIAKLNEMYADLARQVNERSRQLVRSERLAGVGFLAAGVAHEINNPLASISFCAEALQRRLGDLLRTQPDHPDGPVIQNYLRMIEQEAFRCKEITGKLLEFSRVGEKQRQDTDLAEVVQSVIDMVQHLQNHRGKHITFRLHHRPHLMLNAQEIKSVVLNLVVNALESMDVGGELTITLELRDQHAELRFADTGCGMDAETLENIFEPFFTRSRTGKGVGLGLSISHRIITQHGGEVEATSAGPGQGSTFILRLPLAQPEATTEPVRPRLAA
jgi:signal transduction histidine kinase